MWNVNDGVDAGAAAAVVLRRRYTLSTQKLLIRIAMLDLTVKRRKKVRVKF